LAWCGHFHEKARRPFFPTAYLSFLGLFWMTAPLAWLYAVPYERFLPPLEATRANLLTLGVVSVWRVALMVRVLVVIFGYRVWAAFGVVMLFGDTVTLIAVHSLPFPLLGLMGGVRPPDLDQLLIDTACCVLQLGCVSSFVWVLMAVFGWIESRLHWQVPVGPAATPDPSLPLCGLALASIGVWAFVLPYTQPEQQLRFRVENCYREGRYADLLAEMSQHERAEFPPHWEPPPAKLLTMLQPQDVRGILQVCNQLDAQPTATWVRESYIRKLLDLSVYRIAPQLEKEVENTLNRLARQVQERQDKDQP
jgi:hypothetical protein